MVADRDEPLASVETEELELVSRALAGDGLAFRRLVEPHLPLLFRIAARASGDRALAEDAVQDALAVAFERLRVYRGGNLRAFLCAIAAQKAHTLLRAERRRTRRELGSAEPHRDPPPDEQHQAARAEAAVRAALAKMPNKRREAVLLRLDAGLSHAQIARAIGSTEGSVRVLVHQALAELRELLTEYVS